VRDETVGWLKTSQVNLRDGVLAPYTVISDAGAGAAASGSISGNPFHLMGRQQERQQEGPARRP
jgi:hypothetical protein